MFSDLKRLKEYFIQGSVSVFVLTFTWALSSWYYGWKYNRIFEMRVKPDADSNIIALISARLSHEMLLATWAAVCVAFVGVLVNLLIWSHQLSYNKERDEEQNKRDQVQDQKDEKLKEFEEKKNIFALSEMLKNTFDEYSFEYFGDRIYGPEAMALASGELENIFKNFRANLECPIEGAYVADVSNAFYALSRIIRISETYIDEVSGCSIPNQQIGYNIFQAIVPEQLETLCRTILNGSKDIGDTDLLRMCGPMYVSLRNTAKCYIEIKRRLNEILMKRRVPTKTIDDIT